MRAAAERVAESGGAEALEQEPELELVPAMVRGLRRSAMPWRRTRRRTPTMSV